MSKDGFCPKCGALMYNSVCLSCGHGKRAFETQRTTEGTLQQGMQQAGTGGRYSGNAGSYTTAAHQQNAPAKGGRAGIWILVIVILCLCVSVPVILVGVLVSQVGNVITDFQEVIPEPGYEYEEAWPDDAYSDWEEDYYYDEYIPDPSDEYLESIVSSTVRGLSYEIAWTDTYLYADDEDNMAGFYCYYPFIIDSDAAYVDSINAAISQEALSYMPSTLKRDDYGYLDGYVTYMSEELLSVVFVYYYDRQGDETYRISALNFDMTTGEQLPIEAMLPEFEFIAGFRASCEEQNGYDSYGILEEMTDDEILQEIMNPETGVAFYSPVGVDIGFNYPDGWMTVTMKYGKY